MKETNQNQNSTSTGFDKELNDMILRKKQLQKAIISIVDDLDVWSQKAIDNLTIELRELDKTLKEKFKKNG